MDKIQKQESIDHLNLLLKRNYDAEAGFKEAAEKVEHSLLADYFKGSAHQHYTFGHELKEEIVKLDGKPNKGTSLEGDVHRIWMDLKEMVAKRDHKAMLKECDRGEKTALEAYERILEEDTLTPSALKVVQKQRDTITQNIRHIENLLENINK